MSQLLDPMHRRHIESLEIRGVYRGELTEKLIDRFLVACADPKWWTQTIAFTAVQGRAPALEPRMR
jgi:hypothetical protein